MKSTGINQIFDGLKKIENDLKREQEENKKLKSCIIENKEQFKKDLAREAERTQALRDQLKHERAYSKQKRSLYAGQKLQVLASNFVRIENTIKKVDVCIDNYERELRKVKSYVANISQNIHETKQYFKKIVDQDFKSEN